jgi:uncharacterized protein (DUF433 family)
MAITDATTDGRPDGATEPDATIALDPHRPGIQRARLVAYGVPVWALIGHMTDVDDEAEIARTADDYRLPIEAVRAAVAFYREHQCAIDTLLDTNSAATY